MTDHLLFRRIDNSPLILFRIFFGILVSLECYGAIATGWVRRTLVEPGFTFSFIGFEWLQPLPGAGMYVYFLLMGTLGVLIAIGYQYRLSIISFTVLWTAVYLMQKTSYNNHYYLLIIISLFMCFFPANRRYSIDTRRNPELRSHSMYSYIEWIIVCQLLIVYTYAAVAKLYGDWLDLSFIRLLMQSKAHYYLIGDWLQQEWVLKAIRAAGILFDLMIVPALLWKPTRLVAFAAAIGFHLFNSIVFQIGIFPYLSLAFTVFFFEPETIRKRFFSKEAPWLHTTVIRPPERSWILWGWGGFLAIQLLLPLRHHLIKDDVLWTEEGHRLSWRMMLRSRTGQIQFRVVDKANGSSSFVNLGDYLTAKQRRRLAAYPDFIWQFAQHLKQEYAALGKDVSVYAKAKVSINGRPMKPFIDAKTDLAREPWSHFRHHEWILPSDFGPEEVRNQALIPYKTSGLVRPMLKCSGKDIESLANYP